MLLSLFASRTRAEILYNIENPATGVPVAGIGVISLWAFSTTPGATMSVEVDIDNGAGIVPLPCGTERLDVKNAYPQYANAFKSACVALMNWGNLPPGIHSLTWRMSSSAGESKSETRLVTTVRYGDAAFADAFDISQATVWLDQSTKEAVFENVKVRNAETGQWKTTTLRFHFVISAQGLELSSALTVQGNERLAYVFDPGGDSPEIRRYVADSLIYLADTIGRQPANFTVFMFLDLDKLVDAYMAWRKMPTSQRDTLRARWANQVGESGYDFLFLNLNNSYWRDQASDLDQEAIILHELFHILQNQLVGWPGVIRGPDDTTPFGGPRWLIEGVAVYIENVRKAQKGGWTLDPVRASMSNQARTCGLLQSLESWAGILASGQGPAYALGFLAVDFMARPFRNLIGFWEMVGMKGRWEDAFVAAFGMDIQTFYDAFEAHRKTL